MPKESFMLVSLDEDKAKKLAQVISNETCTKILNHLANGKDGTETEIAERLKMPLSTVHYNLKQLVEAKLVVADEYHYSEKGREVKHYQLANKYIIIAPSEERESFMKKLQGFLPALFITLGTAAVVKIASDYLFRRSSSKMAADMTMAAFEAAPEASIAATDAIAGGAGEPALRMAVAESAPILPQAAPLITNEAMLFFVAGAVFIIALLAISAYVNRK